MRTLGLNLLLLAHSFAGWLQPHETLPIRIRQTQRRER